MKTIKTYLLICMAVLGMYMLLPAADVQAASASIAPSTRQVRVNESERTVTIDFKAFSNAGYTYTLLKDNATRGNLNPHQSVDNGTVHATFSTGSLEAGLYKVKVTSTETAADTFTVGFYTYPGIKSLKFDGVNLVWQDASAKLVGPNGKTPNYQIRYYNTKEECAYPVTDKSQKKTKGAGVTKAEILQKWNGGVYQAVVTPFLKDANGTPYYGGEKTVGVKVIKAPTNVNAVAGYKSATVKWTASKAATSYVVKDRTSGKSYTVAGGKTTSFTVTGLTEGKNYRFTVYAKMKVDKLTSTSPESASVTVTIPKATTAKVSDLQVTGSKGKHTISWTGVSNVDGYKVYYKKSSDADYTFVGATTSTSMFTKRMSESTTYTVMVKPYTLINKQKIDDAAGAATQTVDTTAPAPVKNTVRTIGYYSKATTTTNLYNTMTSNTVAATAKKGAEIEQLEPENTKYGKCKVLYQGKVYYCKRSNIKSYAPHYTSTHYSNAVKENYVNKVKKAKSSTKYLIWVSHYTQQVTIFTGSQGNWKVFKSFICATGKHTTRSARGTYKIQNKEKGWYYSTTYEEYITHFFGRNSFHTRIHRYAKNGGGYADATIGKPASNGCVRLYDEDARYIYQNMPKGTTVIAW